MTAKYSNKKEVMSKAFQWRVVIGKKLLLYYYGTV